MASQSEEMLMRVSMDQTGMEAGNRTLLQRAGDTALKYIRVWGDAVKKADTERKMLLKSWNDAVALGAENEVKIEKEKQAKLLAVEKAGHDARVAAYLAAEQKRISAGRANFENTQRQLANDNPARQSIREGRLQSVNDEIAAGSGGTGWLGKAEKATVEGAAFGGGAIAAGGVFKNRMAIMQLIHSARAFVDMLLFGTNPLKAMALEAPQVLQALTLGGMTFKAIALGALKFTGLISGAAIGAWQTGKLGLEMYRTNKSFRQYGESESLGASGAVGISGRLQNMIDSLQEKGVINAAQSARLTTGNQGSYAANIASQRALRKIMDKYQAEHGNDESRIGDADAAYEKSKAQMEALKTKERDLAAITKDIADRNEQIEFLKKNVAALDEKSVDFHEARARLLEKQVEKEKDVTRQKELQAEADRKQKEWSQWSQGAARDYMRRKIQGGQEEREFPTFENLAGRQWTKRFQSQYAAGGRFDLSRGDGPLSGLAREYITAQQQQLWDRTYGNPQQADHDRMRMVNARNLLIANGAANPSMLLGKIGDDTGKLRELFDFMVRTGIIIKGTNDDTD